MTGSNAGLSILGLALGASLLASSVIVSGTLLEARQDRTLEVKGYAEKAIESDWATWTGTLTTRAPSLEAAYAGLEQSRAALRSFLAAESVPADAVELLPATTNVLFARTDKGMMTNDVEGYALNQQVRIGSHDIDLVSRVAERAGDLAKQGVELSGGWPQYFYTRLGDLKIDMLAEATADARRRAEALATPSGSRVGPLRSARQGVFQITPAHSTEVSDYGRNDTTSRQKSIKAVVTMRFAIEG